MAAYCAGDARAFDRLYDLIGPKLHGFFMRSFNNAAVADDLLQTTLLKVHRARLDFRQALPLRPWVFAIAARVRLDEYRKRRNSPVEFDEEAFARSEETEPDGVASVSGETPGRDRAEQVRAALAALPDSQRVIIHLHRFEGMSFPEIASALGTTEGAVKLRAFRGYQRLRKQLQPLIGSEAQR